MADEPDRPRAPLDHTRQVTIDALCEHFANDAMSLDEFERRVETAHTASTNEALKELLRDLPGGDLPAVRSSSAVPVPTEVPGRGYSVVPASSVKESEFVVAVMGGTGRSGHWRPARRNTAIAIFGGAELDFREAALGPGVTELRVYTMFGGVEVIVPPELNVESHGIALLGGFEHVADSSAPPDPGAPTLRITGLAVMGGVEVSVRHAGETARDARRRRRQDRRDKRRRLRGG